MNAALQEQKARWQATAGEYLARAVEHEPDGSHARVAYRRAETAHTARLALAAGIQATEPAYSVLEPYTPSRYRCGGCGASYSQAGGADRLTEHIRHAGAPHYASSLYAHSKDGDQCTIADAREEEKA
jgi:hypothetical protein